MCFIHHLNQFASNLLITEPLRVVQTEKSNGPLRTSQSISRAFEVILVKPHSVLNSNEDHIDGILSCKRSLLADAYHRLLEIIVSEN